MYFASRALEKKLGTEKARIRHFGAPVAGKLTLRLSQLSAAPTLGDMKGVPGNCHELRKDRAGQLAVALSKGVRLLEVTDYHGD